MCPFPPFSPLLTAPLVNNSAEVGKEKSQLGRALLTMTSFPGGLAQPVLGFIARRAGFALLSVPSVPLGAGALLRRGWRRRGGGRTAARGRNYRSLWATAGMGTAGTQRHGVGSDPSGRGGSLCRALFVQGCDLGLGHFWVLPVSPAEAADLSTLSFRSCCCSWMAPRCYLLLPLDGEVRSEGKHGKSRCVPRRPRSLRNHADVLCFLGTRQFQAIIPWMFYTAQPSRTAAATLTL